MIEVTRDTSAYTNPYRATIPVPPPEKHTRRNIIISLVGVIVIAVIAVLVIVNVKHTQVVDSVKNTLISQNDIMKNTAKDGAYAATLPAGVTSTENVKVVGTVSFDGATYCLTGTSLSDDKIVYNIGSHSVDNTPTEGDCLSLSSTIVPTTPSVPSVGSVGTDDISLSWSAATYAASYKVRCATDQAFTKDVATGESKITNVVVNKLRGGTDYYCAVQAINERGSSQWSAVVSTKTSLASAAPVITITPISASEIKYSWTLISGATSYELEYSSDINFVKDVKKVTTQMTGGSTTGLSAGTMYYYHVRAFTSQFDASTAAFSGVVEDKTK